MDINYAELYGAFPSEKDFSGAINRSISNGVKHLGGSFLRALKLIQKERKTTMEDKDKKLLLIDLCGRSPYGIIINVNGNDERVDEVNPFEGIITCGFQSFDVDECKPYLRSMDSMTEEETKELFKEIGFEFTCNTCGIPAHYNYEFAKQIKGIPTITNVEFIEVIDWLNAHHFDYRGLIEKGLAIEVTEENNPYK